MLNDHGLVLRTRPSAHRYYVLAIRLARLQPLTSLLVVAFIRTKILGVSHFLYSHSQVNFLASPRFVHGQLFVAIFYLFIVCLIIISVVGVVKKLILDLIFISDLRKL